MKSDEASRIAEALDHYAEEYPQAVAFLYLLILTGARKSEIAEARWDWIDGNRLELPDSKTGARTIFLPPQVTKILNKLPRTMRTITGLKDPRACWDKVKERAKVQNLRIHDLRHSFASAALAAGLPLSQIGELLGHKSTQTTKRYAHLIDDIGHAAAELAAKQMLSMMTTKEQRERTELLS